MKAISILEGMLIAFLLAVSSIIAGSFFLAIFGAYWMPRFNLLLLAMLYLAYLCYRSDRRSGKLVLAAASIFGVGGMAIFVSSYWIVSGAGLLLIGVARCLLFRRSGVTAAADLFLTGCAASVAYFMAISGSSAGMAVWCFFLMQALWVLIPERQHCVTAKTKCAANEDTFNKAYASAEAAIKRLVNNEQAM